jgi:hypothetical protein
MDAWMDLDRAERTRGGCGRRGVTGRRTGRRTGRGESAGRRHGDRYRDGRANRSEYYAAPPSEAS